MTIQKFEFACNEQGVIPHPNLKAAGAVVTTGGARIGKDYITLMLPRNEAGVVEVIKAQFAHYRELSDFLMNGELLIK